MAELNPAQQQAVQAAGGPQLILAGAGSGKTRTVVHRIGHLIAVRGVAPHRVLAVTFTNKAAAELKSRLTDMIGDDAGGVVSGTFHAVSLRFLRRYADALGYPRSFQVVDADDQKILIKRLLKTHNIAAERLHPSYLLGWIEHCKHAGLTPSEAPEHGWNGVDMRELYREYQAELKRLERMDFSDLILNVVLLLRDHPDVAAALRGRFDHVLVDEYQDTNPVQHEWLIRLCDEHRNLTVVGDDDQSIYGWRGADIRHILDFDKLWGGAGTHRLEENYRSTGAILKLANAVIQANSDRHAKELRATREDGALPEWQVCNDEYDEARKICRLIQRWRDQGRPWSEIAVLYRSNRQSLPLEQIMRESGIPYRIVGGVGFFERMEIKDALAYWSLLNQCGDALHLLRICNKPKRGIGAKGMEQLAAQLAASGMRVAEWLDIVADGQAGGAAKKIEGLACLLRDMRSNNALSPDYGLNDILDASGYLKSLNAMGELEAAARLENIRTLQAYIELSMSEGLTPIEFMDRAALLQGTEDMQAGENEREEDAISMMSLHRAKGLEFDCVALAGIEEGMLPHQRAVDEGESGISEERRLLYVGITRARTHLMLTSARQRRLFGDTHYPLPSRFIKQLPRDILQRESTAQESGFSVPAGTGVNLGGNVRHPSFGEGVVISLEGAGDAVRVTVEFRHAGTKRLMLKYASLEPV
ncbi:MAG TPA: UvrD-helicase domain-containing protein [Mariprofundaceae bacterium]|nr:UvrD-helicase domain-containing protein [Mariprofundaceae bacterium]